MTDPTAGIVVGRTALATAAAGGVCLGLSTMVGFSTMVAPALVV
jgi:hypothetical protein